jgi:aryl-alcohol dehydrogenase-like predicted oxidoreductase
MRYTLLGDSGLRVSQMALGTMTFGTDWGFGADDAECARQAGVYADAGGNFIDTAVNYTGGSSERIVGGIIAPDRDRWVLATKYTLSRRDGDPNASGNSRKNLMRSLEQSLRVMSTDYIDLYWVHVWDFLTSPDEVMRALDDAVRSGKVLYVGISDTPAWLVARMQTIAELRGWSPFIGLQIKYSLADRDVERELLPMAQSLGLGVTAWGPLSAGALTGKYNRPAAEGEVRRIGDGIDRRILDIAAVVLEIADQLGVPPVQVPLAWVRQQGTIPIVGARTAEQLQQSIAANDVMLPTEALERLDTVSRVDLGFPHDFVANASIRHITYGGTRGSIDLPPGRRRI